jgi:hypothetical protein
MSALTSVLFLSAVGVKRKRGERNIVVVGGGGGGIE